MTETPWDIQQTVESLLSDAWDGDQYGHLQYRIENAILNERNSSIDRIASRFAEVLPETKEQRDLDGKVRWLYMVNWIVSVIRTHNPDFDAVSFYKSIGADKK